MHHQRRVLSFIELFHPDSLHPEVSIPQSAREIDALLTLEDAGEMWGPLREVLSHREVLLEHFSATPRRQHLYNIVLKFGYLLEEWEKSKERYIKQPFVLILSHGKPRTLLEEYRVFEASPTQGLYWGSLLRKQDMVLVDTKEPSRNQVSELSEEMVVCKGAKRRQCRRHCRAFATHAERHG